MNYPRIIAASSVALGLTVFATPGAFAASQCIPQMEIDHTTVIDENTILVTLRGKETFKRIELSAPCPGLKFRGFSHTTTSNDLCRSDSLKVVEPQGQICVIKEIADIAPADAKALQMKK